MFLTDKWTRKLDQTLRKSARRSMLVVRMAVCSGSVLQNQIVLVRRRLNGWLIKVLDLSLNYLHRSLSTGDMRPYSWQKFVMVSKNPAILIFRIKVLLYHEDGSTIFLRKFGKFIPDYMTSHPRTLLYGRRCETDQLIADPVISFSKNGLWIHVLAIFKLTMPNYRFTFPFNDEQIPGTTSP